MQITLPSGTPAEIARPASGHAGSGLIITPDIWGLRPLYAEMAKRLADDWQMVVCVVENFPGTDYGTDGAARQAAVAGLIDDDHLRDLEHGADATGCEVVNLLGHCMGGMYCYKAARSDRFHRIVAFYGIIRLPENWRTPNQAEPLDILHNGHAERVLAIVGGRDTYTPPDAVEALADTGVTVVVYPQADHGFAHDVARPAHRVDDAADAHARAREWLLS